MWFGERSQLQAGNWFLYPHLPSSDIPWSCPEQIPHYVMGVSYCWNCTWTSLAVSSGVYAEASLPTWSSISFLAWNAFTSKKQGNRWVPKNVHFHAHFQDLVWIAFRRGASLPTSSKWELSVQMFSSIAAYHFFSVLYSASPKSRAWWGLNVHWPLDSIVGNRGFQICHLGILIILNEKYLRNSRCGKDTLSILRLHESRRWIFHEKGTLPIPGGIEDIFITRHKEFRAEKSSWTNLVMASPFTIHSLRPSSCQFFTNVSFLCLKGIKASCVGHFSESHIFVGSHTYIHHSISFFPINLSSSYWRAVS